MSARRGKTQGHYPNLDTRDILRDGHVVCCRNPVGRRFGKRDAVRIESAWSTFEDLPEAVRRVKEEELARTTETPAAWDPEFGYLSPEPQFCGNNLYINCMVHLEALNLLGDLKFVLAGLDALRLNAWGFEADIIHDAAHIYHVENRFSLGITEETLVTRVTNALRGVVQQEINARLHLVEEYKRILADALARSLAILRAARLLSPWELTDILSPIRMAAAMGFIEGITKEEIDDFTLNQLAEPPDKFDTRDQARARDKRDASFADRMNRRFAQVGLNARGRKLLEP